MGEGIAKWVKQQLCELRRDGSNLLTANKY
jgi:hypothetical protein